MAYPQGTSELICKYLQRAGKPVPIGDVIDYVLSVKSYSGQTPRKSINSLIQRCDRIKRKNGFCSLA